MKKLRSRKTGAERMQSEVPEIKPGGVFCKRLNQLGNIPVSGDVRTRT